MNFLINMLMGFWEALQWMATKWWLWLIFAGIWVIVTLIIKGGMSLFGAIGTALIVPVAAVFVTANLISSIAWASRWLPNEVERQRAKSAEFDALCLDLEGLFDAPPKWLSGGDTAVTPPDGSDPNQGGGQYNPGDPNQGGSIPPDQSPYTPALEPEYSMVQVEDFQACVWQAYKEAGWAKKIPMNSAPPWGTELTDWSDQEILVVKNKGGDFYLFSGPWPGPVKIERVIFTRWSALGIEIGAESAKSAMETSLGRTIQDDVAKAFAVSGTGVLPPQCYIKQPVEPAVAPATAPAQQQTPAPAAPTPTPGGIPVVEPVFITPAP